MAATVPTVAELVKRYGTALTGGVATGKSTVAALVRRAGVVVIDADELARQVTAPGTPGLAAVAATFGQDLVTAAGELDRKRLGALVFAAPEKRRQLEALLHPRIREALGERLTALGLVDRPRPFVYEAALIYEAGRAGEFRAVWATDCPRPVQLERLMKRNGIDAAAAERIVASQWPSAEKAARADVTIATDVPLETLAETVSRLVRTL
jgi:dephospho-CoA kinase